MNDIPIDRLLAYQDAATKLRDREKVNLGDLVLVLGEIPPNTVVHDLKTLEMSNLEHFSVQEFERRVRRAASRTLSKTITPSIRMSPEYSANVLKSIMMDEDSRSLSRAEGREAALAFGKENPDHFLLSLGCLAHKCIAYKHQVDAARKIVDEMLACGMVADEVGLGKTITGGLVLLELIERGLIDTSLILVPSNLLAQWAKELHDFFGLKPVVVRGRSVDALAALRAAPHLMLDTDRAKIAPYTDILLQRKWGCLLVDEAHRLRTYDTARSRFCYSLQAVHRVYLTATPVHNSAFDVFTQVTSLRPGVLGHRDSYRDIYLTEDGFVQDPKYLQDKLSETITRTRRTDTDLRFAERRIKLVSIPVKDRTKLESDLYTNLLQFLRGAYRRHLSGAVPIRTALGTEQHVSQFVLIAIMVLREMGSHPRAALKTLRTALRDRVQKLAEITKNYADVDALDMLLQRYAEVKWTKEKHKKTEALLRRLPWILRKLQKCVIYTEFIETMETLKPLIDELTKEGEQFPFDLITYHGQLSRRAKTAAIERFTNSHEPCILLSTDCGGEGLNLQEAGVVINYDFPWNPMRIEQRIGRIDRIGQRRKRIYIYNFVTEGTIERYVYAVLEEKLEVCEDIMGDFNSPITRLMLRRRSDLGIGDIILNSENDEDMARRFEHLHDDVDSVLREWERYERRKYDWF